MMIQLLSMGDNLESPVFDAITTLFEQEYQQIKNTYNQWNNVIVIALYLAHIRIKSPTS